MTFPDDNDENSAVFMDAEGGSLPSAADFKCSLVQSRDQKNTTLKEEEELLAALNDADEYEEMDDKDLTHLFSDGLAVREADLQWGKEQADEMERLGCLTLSKTERMRLLAELDSVRIGSGNGGDAFGPPRVLTEQEEITDLKLERLLEDYDDHEIGELDEFAEGVQGKLAMAECEEALDEYIE